VKIGAVKYDALDPALIIATAETLRTRIHERFPAANLVAVADDLLRICRAHAERSTRIRRPDWFWRITSFTLLAAGTALFVALFPWQELGRRADAGGAVQTIEASVSMLVYLGGAALLVAGLDQRSRRHRCLNALHELRAMAHIVDMHQLTKDPDRTLQSGPDTPSSPKRDLTPFQMGRYLDYCTEMLSLVGKVAALYVQRFPDPVAVAAADDIENLATGLASRIGQKLLVLGPCPPDAPAGSP
jgi:hypothetical protein